MKGRGLRFLVYAFRKINASEFGAAFSTEGFHFSHYEVSAWNQCAMEIVEQCLLQLSGEVDDYVSTGYYVEPRRRGENE